MTAETLPSGLGPLAAALAKAQTAFPPIKRDKRVTVQTRTGGSYSFNYAPLDTILDAVRGPLAANGLAIVQMLDEGALVTSLMHESGAIVSGRLDLPPTQDVQGLGSAITYLRRYALQAALGIAAEEDDDGNHAAGNVATPAQRPARPEATSTEPVLVPLGPDTHTGRVTKGDGSHNDVEYHPTPTGHRIGFKLALGSGQAVPQVICDGPVGEALFLAVPAAELLGADVTVVGQAYRVETPGRRAYRRLMVERISGPGFAIPPTDTPAEPSGAPRPVSGGLSPEQEAELDELRF